MFTGDPCLQEGVVERFLDDETIYLCATDQGFEIGMQCRDMRRGVVVIDACDSGTAPIALDFLQRLRAVCAKTKILDNVSFVWLGDAPKITPALRSHEILPDPFDPEVLLEKVERLLDYHGLFPNQSPPS